MTEMTANAIYSRNGKLYAGMQKQDIQALVQGRDKKNADKAAAKLAKAFDVRTCELLDFNL